MYSAIIISADEIKKSLPGYTPEKVEKFHSKSARIADKQFELSLKSSEFDKVILLNGGTASGKTEFLLTHLAKKNSVIFDGTMPTIEGVKNKIRVATREDKEVEIYAVMPDDLKRAFVAFLNRDRRFKDIHFYRTHSGSRKALLHVAENYPHVRINIIESTYNLKEKLEFTKINFKNRKDLIEYLKSIQLSKTDIIKLLI